MKLALPSITGWTLSPGIEIISDGLLRLQSNLITSANKQGPIDLDVGGVSDGANSPHIQRLPDGRYRLYYAYFNGLYHQLSYRDTTDMNLPNSSNLGVKIDLGMGEISDHANYPHIQRLPDLTYRLYHARSGGTYPQLSYRDTTDTNLPNSTNLGLRVDLDVGGISDGANSPHIQRLSGGEYRIYYTYSNGPYSQLSYRDTTDTNLPNSSNLGLRVDLGVGGISDHASYPHIQRLPGGQYRIYYTYSYEYEQLSYRDTTDTNLPDSSNLGLRVDLGVGGISDAARLAHAQQRLDGKYRIYYARNDGSYFQLSYRDMNDDWVSTSPVAESPWMAVPSDTLQELSFFENPLGGIGVVLYQFAINNVEEYPEWSTLESLNGMVFGTPVLDHVNSVKLKAELISDGTVPVQVELGYLDVAEITVGGGGCRSQIGGKSEVFGA